MKRLIALTCLAGLMAWGPALMAQEAPEESPEAAPGEEMPPPGELGEEPVEPMPPMEEAEADEPVYTETQEATSITMVEEVDRGHPIYDRAGIVVNPHIGVLIPQLFSELGTWPIFGLEVGYILPFDAGPMIRPLQIGVDVQYTQPSADGEGQSPNLGEDGASFQWEMDQQILTFDLSFLWRFMPPAEGFAWYAETGPRLYLMNTIVNASGNGGNDFGENEETNNEFGFFVATGGEYALGPGSLYGALEFGWSDLDQRVTGDSNTGAFSVDVGYRFMF